MDACFGKSIVEPRRGAVAKIPTDGSVNGRQHLQQDEHDARCGEGRRQSTATLNCRNEQAHDDREHSRQNAAQDEHSPPCRGQYGVSLGQDAEKLPLLALSDRSCHG